MHTVNNNYFNYTDTSVNSLGVDSLSDTHYWVNPIPYLYYTLHKIGHLDNFFSYIKCMKTDFLANWKAKHIWGPSGKVSKIRGNTPRSGDITCMPVVHSGNYVHSGKGTHPLKSDTNKHEGIYGRE